MKPVIWAASDLHLTDKRGEEYRHDTMHRIVGMLDRERPDAFLILGDLTEDKDRHAAQLVNRVVAHMDTFASIVPTYVLMGNHDYHNEGHPFFAFLSRIKGLRFIDKVTPGPMLSRMFEHMIFLPHTRDWQTDWAGINWPQYDLAFAHNTFTGAKSAQDHSLEGIPTDAIPGKIEVIAGDVHVPQSWSGITYIGAPYAVDFGDNYKPRILEITGTHYNDRKDISLADFPQKQLVEIDDFAEIEHATRNIGKGDVVKMRIGIDDMGQWHGVQRDARTYLEKIGAIPFKLEPILAKGVVKRRHEIVKKADTSVQSEKDVLRSFAKRHDVRDDDLDEAMDIIEHGDDAVAGLKK